MESNMTKKDYVLIARAIKNARERLEESTGELASGHTMASFVAAELCDELRRENPRFDPYRFIMACGVDAYGVMGSQS